MSTESRIHCTVLLHGAVFHSALPRLLLPTVVSSSAPSSLVSFVAQRETTPLSSSALRYHDDDLWVCAYFHDRANDAAHCLTIMMCSCEDDQRDKHVTTGWINRTEGGVRCRKFKTDSLTYVYSRFWYPSASRLTITTSLAVS